MNLLWTRAFLLLLSIFCTNLISLPPTPESGPAGSGPAGSGPAGSENLSADTRHERDMAVASLIDASVRLDVPGLAFARNRFLGLADQPGLESETLYFIAFADWQLAMNLFTKTEEASRYLDDGFECLDRLTQKQPGHGMAWLLKLRLLYWRSLLAPEKAAEVWPVLGETLKKAQTLLPEHPVTLLNLGLAVFYGPGKEREKGVALMEKANQAFEEWANPSDPHQVFWYALGCAWLGNHYMMLPQPQIEKAKAVLQKALRFRPDYAMVRDTLLPATEMQVFCAATEVENLSWNPLAADPKGDGADRSLADAKELSYAYDRGKDMLWFRFELHQMPSQEAFGVNLAVDTDGDETNGAGWWGGNRAFKFDKLVTVWVARGLNGQYAGTVGIADAGDVMRGRMTGLARNTIAFTRDEAANTIVIGFERALLSGSGNVRLIGAVGSNSQWNDDLPNKGSVSVELGSLSRTEM